MPISFTSAEIAAWVGSFLWPLVRIAAMVSIAPVFGAQMVPMRIRLLTAVALTWVVFPTLSTPPTVDLLSLAGVLVVAQQMLIGLLMGFMLQMVFGAFILGGNYIATSMGLGFASMVDPGNGVQVPVVSQYYTIMVTMMFLALNGHLLFLEVLMASFHSLPIGGGGLLRSDYLQVVHWSSQMFVGSMLISLPAITSVLLINLAFGVVTRAAPQLNIFAVGFPVTMLAGFIIMMELSPAIQPQLELLLESSFQVLWNLGEVNGGP